MTSSSLKPSKRRKSQLILALGNPQSPPMSSPTPPISSVAPPSLPSAASSGLSLVH
ncbi:hypothetical protein RchiOBHm_Chr5g0038321 [Rosa chinensis]|uniref:Uncharacterized protein n=1 Tax=Rosa chinensis TaxID=74649 RepID=A0A2P6QBY9_ROSCH|nr:hypothetical protein RchiOBHm_Chr5g0038321 [Rosa chinensis]